MHPLGPPKGTQSSALTASSGPWSITSRFGWSRMKAAPSRPSTSASKRGQPNAARAGKRPAKPDGTSSRSSWMIRLWPTRSMLARFRRMGLMALPCRDRAPRATEVTATRSSVKTAGFLSRRRGLRRQTQKSPAPVDAGPFRLKRGSPERSPHLFRRFLERRLTTCFLSRVPVRLRDGCQCQIRFRHRFRFWLHSLGRA